MTPAELRQLAQAVDPSCGQVWGRVMYYGLRLLNGDPLYDESVATGDLLEDGTVDWHGDPPAVQNGDTVAVRRTITLSTD